MLGEEVTKNIAIADDAIGFEENKKVAKEGGKLAGDARKKVEKDRRVQVVSPDNFLAQIKNATGAHPPVSPIETGGQQRDIMPDAPAGSDDQK